MGKILEGVISLIVAVLDSLLPVLGIPDEFFEKIDTSFAFLIGFLESANFFVPLDVLVLCFSVALAVDHFAFLIKIGKWIIKIVTNLIPGT